MLLSLRGGGSGWLPPLLLLWCGGICCSAAGLAVAVLTLGVERLWPGVLGLLLWRRPRIVCWGSPLVLLRVLRLL